MAILINVFLLSLLLALPSGVLAAPQYCMDPSQAASDFYMHPREVDFIHVLAPPPAPDSPAGRADLQAVLEAQRARTPASIESARADACLSIFRFADVMGPGFAPERLPFTIVLFQHVFTDEQEAVAAAKDHFKRPRPFVADHELSPIVKQRANPSYPSGHATFAYVTAILLADMVPEKAPQIFARATEYAHNRVVAGVHYPTDVEAGRVTGAVIDNVLLHDPRFNADLARAKAEVRRAVGVR
ncbi:MAG TPA: phosphatase PAP2 family protein [Candidatus Binataceae bacterium]|nr:phosphatase PAP2 family protein [Candidatus Binataceae bacterium]